MIRVSSVSVTPGMRSGQRQFLLRWRAHVRHRGEIWEKCRYWFADRDEANDVRDAMRRGETFEMALALMQARAGMIDPSIKALGYFVPGYHDY